VKKTLTPESIVDFPYRVLTVCSWVCTNQARESNLKHVTTSIVLETSNTLSSKIFAWHAGGDADSNSLLLVAKMNTTMVGIGTASISMSLYNKATHRN